MRVTFVCPSGKEPIGGVTAIYEFANGLARRDHDIHLVHLPWWGRQVDSLEDLDRYHFEPQITHYLPGADPASLPDSDVVFGTGAPERLGLPVLLVQGIDMLHPHLERQALRTPGLKVCVASWLVDVGVRYGVPADQMQVVPYGIDHDRFRITVPVDQRPRQVSILHSSHVAKGWDVGLAALHEIRARQPDVRVRAFGTSVPQTSLPDWVELFRNPSASVLVEEIYNQSQVFIQASDYEGFGFTAVEAMACGAALVTTDNGGSDDYAIPGETAMVAAPRDASALARATIDLIDDDESRWRLAGAGARYVQRFNWDLSAERLEGLLQRYLADPASFQQPPGPELSDSAGDSSSPLLRTRPAPG